MAFNANEHLMNLKGKSYLPVAWRLVWLREDQPNAEVRTEIVKLDLENQFALFRATITIPNGGVGTGYGSETGKDFGDFIEKAETKAVGRALAQLGFGTQFSPELDEGTRIVDAPVERRTDTATSKPRPSNDKNKPTAKQVEWLVKKELAADEDEAYKNFTFESAKDALDIAFGKSKPNSAPSKPAPKKPAPKPAEDEEVDDLDLGSFFE